MDDLKKLVKKLEKNTDNNAQIQILQEIGTKLINEYEIHAGGLTIEPLWVEAYYYNKENFPDCNTHMSEKQKNRFGQLYFHEEGRGGFDICLSDSSEYYLSFLLKATLIDGKFTIQTGIYDVLNCIGKNESELENEKGVLIKREPSKTYDVMHTKRVGVNKPCYQNENLASFSRDALANKKYNFKFARENLRPIVKQTMEKYITDNPGCTKKEYKDKCKEFFGWVPDIVEKLIKE